MLNSNSARWNPTALLALLSLMGLALGGCGKSPGPAGSKTAQSSAAPPPNILLISIDTLRPDHLGCYGYARKTSPRIDQFAAEGVVFEHAFSSTAWTMPSHWALFTGLPDTVHGCLDVNQTLAENRTTWAQRMKALGYVTAGFYSGPLVGPEYGFPRGFDQYSDCTGFQEALQKALAKGKTAKDVAFSANTAVANPITYRAVQKWFATHEQRPFFLFVHLWDVHEDYVPPPPYDKMFDPDYSGPITGQDVLHNPAINKDMPKRDLEHLIALYDGEIAWTDSFVGRILDDLDRLHLRDSTIVAILSDHGEEFFEHGERGHHNALYDEITRIALLMRYPGHLPAGQRVAEQVRIIDVLPTVFELAGLAVPQDIRGQSLLPLTSGKPLASDNLAICEIFSNGHESRSFRRPDRKLIMNLRNGTNAAYDLAADPHESTPVTAEQNPTLVDKLLADAQAGLRWLKDARQALSTVEGPPMELPENLKKSLITLGYIDGPPPTTTAPTTASAPTTQPHP